MIWNKIMGEFVDVIEWTDDSPDTLVYRFERHGNEIKYGARLTVRESQVAIFVNEGRIADVFQPGLYTLETQNMPVMTTLESWPHGFKSPFKAEVYFVNTRRFTGLKWGTKNPIMLRDKEFGPVRLRAFGTYMVRVGDPVAFLKEVVGTDGVFTTGEISEQLRDLVVSRFASVIGESAIPVLDLAANYDELGTFLTERIKADFAALVVELTQIVVENISLPPEVEQALDKRTSMGVIGDVRKYAEFQAAEAMTTAAANPGGPASAGLGLGLGLAMAQQVGGPWGQRQPTATDPGPAGTPPPIPGAIAFFVAVAGKPEGPLDLDQLKQRATAGTLARDSLVWRQGMASWAKAGDVAELERVFADIPPPLPPASV
jgi:membrane protease subunit (stomatin/prohibitin family)